MLMDVLFGNYRQRALTLLLLNPEQDYHVRELARLTGTTAGTLHKELARLAESGLLLRRAQGNQVRYQANTQCPVFGELAGLFRKTTGAVAELAKLLAPLQPQLAVIFGSYARGTEHAGSDIDVLVIADCSFADVAKALYPAQEILQREINPVLYSSAELQRRAASGDGFISGILSHPKLYITGSDHDLAKLAGHPAPAGL